MTSYFTFTALRFDAVQIALGLDQPVGLVNTITKEKGSRRYTVTTDFAMSPVVYGALKALIHIKAIEALEGPYFVQESKAGVDA